MEGKLWSRNGFLLLSVCFLLTLSFSSFFLDMISNKKRSWANSTHGTARHGTGQPSPASACTA